MVRRFLFVFLLAFCAGVSVFARSISDIEQNGSWVYLYDENGRKYHTMSSSIGHVAGWSADFFVVEKDSWVKLYDARGRCYRTMSASSTGRVTAVSGNTFTTRKDGWVYTYDRSGKRINTRSAR